ncbi:MAG: hypothetical protein GXO55_11170, partial [Chloroflexi bacterium]|nr:hypothetical protein [Chloroflexota bacterium]
MSTHEPWGEMETIARTERRLQEMYARPAPDPRFLARLEQDLHERSSRTSRFPFLHVLRRRWAGAMLLALITLLVGVTWVGGPRDAWAQFLRLIGYAPHVGFVDVEEARVLPAAVTRQVGDVTIRVEQVVATGEETRVVVHLKGPSIRIPATREGDAPSFTNADIVLRASDGTQLQARQSATTVGDGEAWITLSFPPLPDHVYQVDLDLSAVARGLHLPAGEWRIPLTIYPAQSDLVAHVLTEPYEPRAAPQTRHGITLRVLRVAHTPEQTALQLQAEFPEQYTTLMASHVLDPLMYDDVGHVYYRPIQGGSQTVVRKEVSVSRPSAPRPTSSATRTTTWEDVRAPLSALARRLTYVVSAVEVMVPLDASFSLDLGENPQPGDVWPLNVRLDVDGVPVWVRKATLLYDPQAHAYHLVFAMETSEVEGKVVENLTLFAPGISTIHEIGGGTTGYPGVIFIIPEEHLPRGTLAVRIQDATMTIKGPWRFEWEVPRPALPPSVKPVVLHPEARASDRGITLWVDTLTLTDRVTVFDLQAETPEGTTLDGVSARLVDAATGREWKPQWHVQWCRKGSQGPVVRPEAVWPPSACGRVFPGRVIFGPLSPATKAVTLKVDAVTLFHKDPVTLTLSLPERLVFDTEVKGSAAMRLDVDTRVQAGPFTIHFTQGWVRDVPPMEVWLLSEPMSKDVLGTGFLNMPLLTVRGDG